MPCTPRAAFINVTEQPFCADPTGMQDSTKAFQGALDAAGKHLTADEPQPNVVFIPAGVYRVDGPIIIPPYVTLKGTWDSPPDPGAFFPSPNQGSKFNKIRKSVEWRKQWWDPDVYLPFFRGTVIVTDYGRNIEDRRDVLAFITLLGPSSTLMGVWIYYPWQGIPDPKNPLGPLKVVPYQWTIRADSLGRAGGETLSCTVSEVLLQNSYSGIDFSVYGGRHILKHIWGQPLREGIRIGHCYDVGRILDVHFWPFWDHGADQKGRDPSVSTVFRDFTATRGFALVLFKSDMQIVHDFFAIGYFVGVHLGFQKEPIEGPQVGWGACTGQFSNLNLDQCANGIDFHATDKSGIQITNANIVCRDLPCTNRTITEPQPLARHAIVAHHYSDADNHEGFPLPKGFLAIRGASIFGSTLNSMVVWASNNTLMLSSSWMKNEADPVDPAKKCDRVMAPIIDVVHGRAIIQANWFQHLNGGAAIRVGPEAEAVIISGNISEGHSYPEPPTSMPAIPRPWITPPPNPALIVSDNILLPFPGPVGAISATTKKHSVGGEVTIKGWGFVPGHTITFKYLGVPKFSGIYSTGILVTADAQGRFEVRDASVRHTTSDRDTNWPNVIVIAEDRQATGQQSAMTTVSPSIWIS